MSKQRAVSIILLLSACSTFLAWRWLHPPRLRANQQANAAPCPKFADPSAPEWLPPIEVSGTLQKYTGYITVERTRLYTVEAKTFNGNYFLSERDDGGKRIPLSDDWYDRLSKLVGKKVTITGEPVHLKSGDRLWLKTLQEEPAEEMPSTTVADEKEIRTLIEGLASSNHAPDVVSKDPDIVYPNGYDHEAQARISYRVHALESKGTAVIPRLIEALNDKRYSYSYDVQASWNATVGDACFMIIEGLFEPDIPWLYMVRKGADGKQYSHVFYLQSRFITSQIIKRDGGNDYSQPLLREWWATRKNRTRAEIQEEVLEAVIAEERRRGFEKAEAEKDIVGPLLEKLKEMRHKRQADNPIQTEIPAGIVAVTEAQKALLAGLRLLYQGAPACEVQRILGEPKEKNDGTWFYRLREDNAEGGFYVSATLTFNGGGLSSAKVGCGHETLMERK